MRPETARALDGLATLPADPVELAGILEHAFMPPWSASDLESEVAWCYVREGLDTVELADRFERCAMRLPRELRREANQLRHRRAQAERDDRRHVERMAAWRAARGLAPA